MKTIPANASSGHENVFLFSQRIDVAKGRGDFLVSNFLMAQHTIFRALSMNPLL